MKKRKSIEKINEAENWFFKKINKINKPWDFPGGSVVKNPPANAGDTGLSPGLGRSHVPCNN